MTSICNQKVWPKCGCGQDDLKLISRSYLLQFLYGATQGGRGQNQNQMPPKNGQYHDLYDGLHMCILAIIMYYISWLV